MRKTLIVAQSEFATLVRSKAFLISLVLMPGIMAASILLIPSTKKTTDGRDRTFAFVDYSGVLAEPLKAVAAMYNSSTALADIGFSRTGARFIPLEIKPDGRDPQQLRLELSDRVRRNELFAFAEFPANI